ncbi:MAG: M1 family aminopeptidase, partial [Bacteroidota bacterium]
PLEYYYYPEDSSKVVPTYSYSKRMFDFLEYEIGVPYPWQNYKQVPVRDFLYAGMENTTLTIFSEAFVVDSLGFVDRNYVNVNAHELAHQWFGNLVTETEGTHHWLHEGFATYYALLAERELFGEDYYYWKLLQSAEQLKALSEQGKGQSLLDPGASSLTFYEKGAWALHILKELIGEVAFKNAVTAYLNNHRYENVTTEDFLREVRKAAVTDIASWEADWLRQTAFQSEQAYASLMKSDFVRAYFEAKALRLQPFSEKEGALRDLLLNGNEYTGQEAVYQLAEVPMKKAIPLYQLALESEHLLVRQAVAESIPEIPNALKTGIEGMLEDGSYVSRELALSRLWEQFPNDRKRYLEATKYMEGFQNKNLKLLWLALAISSEAYGATANEIFVSELKTYASERFSFEVRQLAFDYLIRLQILDDEVMAHLINGSVHHYWRFRDVARQVLDEMWKVESFKTRLIEVLETVPEEERRYLRTKIESE